ncbi:HNH endonuclease domain-containing protein [uncultured Ferrimonas sp.]|uniref:HNH endonuclease n=1 Tax=uncultured Ferrimonas sp. TaxID=432640 RepID=UPI002634A937|nr:HNH endonuclease domain-containing protein [uncultured Ferrimonas sp.]
MVQKQFEDADYWKGIILFGLNAATYKMGLARTLLDFAKQGKTTVDWHELAHAYFGQYLERLSNNPMPQQANPSRMTVMERIVKEHRIGKLTHAEAVERVAEKAFDDVIPRFQTIGTNKELVKGHFYDFHKGQKLELKDSLLAFDHNLINELDSEIVARWSLLEGAFSISQSQFHLANDIRDIYLEGGYERQALTSNIPFLNGYQGNTCFYCGEPLGDDIHVDHVLPRQVLCHDEIWNLVLSHADCNLLKSDKLVGAHFIQKLIARNENIMGSNHPWKQKIATALGTTPTRRAKALTKHYDNVKLVLGSNYWGGSESYNPATDPFFRRLITVLNNKC